VRSGARLFSCTTAGHWMLDCPFRDGRANNRPSFCASKRNADHDIPFTVTAKIVLVEVRFEWMDGQKLNTF
jgi:hypothetical protein